MKSVLLSLLGLLVVNFAHANANLKVNDPAPLFIAKTQAGNNFELATRKGKWTVLYFYPKAGTPGCTKQACAFRDGIAKIRALNAEVYGISADTVAAQAAFHKEHKLSFDLLADPENKILDLYGTAMPLVKVSKRWTFIIGPDLKIKDIMKEVDPVLDSARVANTIAELKKVEPK